MPHVFQKQYFWIPVLVCAICFCVCFAEQIQMEMAVSFDTLFDNDHPLSVCHDDSFADAFGKRRMAPSGETVSMVRRKMPWIAEPYFAVFLLSQFAGYPVGAGMLCTLVKQHCITKKDGEKLLCVCYGGGPAFFVGIVGKCPLPLRNLLADIFCKYPIKCSSLYLTVSFSSSEK